MALAVILLSCSTTTRTILAPPSIPGAEFVGSEECATCHDPHNNQNGNFLVRNVSIQHDALCTSCHAKKGWLDPDSTHRSGGERYPTVQAAVSADGCTSCHRPHSAEQAEHLLKLKGGPLTDAWRGTGPATK